MDIEDATTIAELREIVHEWNVRAQEQLAEQAARDAALAARRRYDSLPSTPPTSPAAAARDRAVAELEALRDRAGSLRPPSEREVMTAELKATATNAVAAQEARAVAELRASKAVSDPMTTREEMRAAIVARQRATLAAEEAGGKAARPGQMDRSDDVRSLDRLARSAQERKRDAEKAEHEERERRRLHDYAERQKYIRG